MRFKIIDEGITFTDVEVNDKGEYIDVNTGLPVNPVPTDIFWYHDPEIVGPHSIFALPPGKHDEYDRKVDGHSEDTSYNEVDWDTIDPDDIDPNDFNPDGEGGIPVPFQPIPIVPLVLKLLQYIDRKSKALDRSYSNTICKLVQSGLDELEFYRWRAMLKIAKQLVDMEPIIQADMKALSDEDAEMCTTMLNNIDTLFKIITSLQRKIKTTYHTDDGIYRDLSKRDKPMRRFGIDEL